MIRQSNQKQEFDELDYLFYVTTLDEKYRQLDVVSDYPRR